VRSALDTMPNEGLVFHAATGALSPNATADRGRCETASTRASSSGTPAAKTAGKESILTDTSVPGSAPSTGYGE